MPSAAFQNAVHDFLNDTFPFYFACGQDLRITHMGRSLRKVMGDGWIGRELGDLVRMELPRGELEFEALVEASSKMVALKFANNLKFRGQIFSDRGKVFFLGSLRCTDAAQMTRMGLTVDDYASHDTAVEMLFLRQAQNTQLLDLNAMVEQLRQAAEDNTRFRATESALMYDLNAAGDICLRFDKTGQIIEARFARETYLFRDVESLIGRQMNVELPSIARVVCPVIDQAGDLISPIPVEFSLRQGPHNYHFEARVAKTLHANYLLLGRDVTERRQLQQRLEHRALHDPLTNLANRTLFRRRTVEAQKSGRHIAVMLVDLNDFKMINDNFGHHVGDMLLTTLAERMEKCTRVSDVASRIGGDEFGILLDGVSSRDFAVSFANRMADELCCPANLDGNDIEPRVSIGMAFDEDGRSPEDLLRDADFAMYEAKRTKQDRVVICDDRLRGAYQQRHQFKHDMAKAIRKREYVPFYQAIVDLADGQIHGFETLVRWSHPDRGILSPFFFLEIAEENGMIGQIGQLMLESACRDMKSLNEVASDPFSINVNLASAQVQDPRLATQVEQVLKESGLPPTALTLEITETALIDDFEQAKSTLQELREQGIQIALDDFGVGYSSLNYLQKLPIDSLKLDRSLIQDICESEEQMRILDCVMQIGRTLGLKIVAEGIETKEQLDAVKALGCDFGQGFYFSKPKPLEEIPLSLDGLPGPSIAANPVAPSDVILKQ